MRVLQPVRTVRPDPIPPRQRYLKRWAALKNERASWMEHWRELAEYVLPRHGRLLQASGGTAGPGSSSTRGQKRHQSIINGTATWAARVLSSGMMAGITSPARPWFRLTTPDPDLAEYDRVKAWLYEVEQRIRQAFARSNVYNHLHQVYEHLGTFGTAAMYVEDEPTGDLLRAYTFPPGQYALANSAKLRVDTVYRELSMTVAQMVEQFGLEAVSAQVRADYERGDLERWVGVLHIIEPNREHVPGRLGPEGMAWRSCWLEMGATDTGVGAGPGYGSYGAGYGTGERFLRESGYHEFPVMCPRWAVSGEDVYGSSPAMDALGDVRALQQYERRKAMVVDKIVNPPMRAPASLVNNRASILPGDVTYVDALGPNQTFAPAMEIQPAAVQIIEASIREHEARAKTAYYADLWLMLAQGADQAMTAREVAERHEEKMLQLGPVMERLQDELLDPLVDRAFFTLLRNGDLPPPPEELQGMDLRVEYLSIMAQAQKMLGITGVERLASFAGSLAAVKPEVLDKLDFDQTVDEYAQMLGTPPALVRTDDAVAELRGQRQQAMAAQQAQAQLAQTVQGAQVLSQTDMGGDTALSRMVGNLGAPVAPGGGAPAGAGGVAPPAPAGPGGPGPGAGP